MVNAVHLVSSGGCRSLCVLESCGYISKLSNIVRTMKSTDSIKNSLKSVCICVCMCPTISFCCFAKKRRKRTTLKTSKKNRYKHVTKLDQP